MTRADCGPSSPSRNSQRVLGRKGDMVARIVYRVWSRWCSCENGQDLLEYALLVALIALAAVAAVTSVGTTINTVLWNAIDATTSAL